MSIDRSAGLDPPGRAQRTPYLVELLTAGSPLAYVLARAGTRDEARALIEAQLGRAPDCEDVTTGSVHPVH